MNYHILVQSIVALHRDSVSRAAAAVNQSLIVRNWLIGAYLVEFEQNGEDRATYGERLLETIASDLKQRDIRGLGVSMLKNCRQFYRIYPPIRQLLSGDFAPIILPPGIRQSPIGESSRQPGSSPSGPRKRPTPLASEQLLRFSWTHFIELIRLDDPWMRAFYENECLKGNWSVRQLQRQIGSMLYERTGLSSDKHAVIEAARRQATQAPAAIADLIRDPYVLEFVGLAEKPHYRESDLESA